MGQLFIPQYKCLLEENERDNRQEDDKCLAELQEIIREYKKNDDSVAGIIVEPIHSDGGDNEASAYFFQQLQEFPKNHQVHYYMKSN